ncbi:hypothetical protein HAZT_HAZT006108 [Hyalella azteca]|uniref:Pentraxin (PTX) domain-containing protein n=1 Tax=Hyalella azteca TaxID=294128 RepID=A0A6A0GZA3_HYAAZ|nr:hypothetical protein HAZT_HAZT006108 [Hyalella azteca]
MPALATLLLVASLAAGGRGQDIQRPEPGSGEETVMLLQRSGTPTATSFARLLNPFPELRNFTACYRIRMHRYREEGTLLSYALSDKEDNALRMDHRPSGYQVTLRGSWATSTVTSPLRYWSHFCFTFNDSDKSWTIFKDGEKKAENKIPNFSGVIAGSGSYVIGQDQDKFGGGFERDQSYSGEITQLNYWHRALDAATIRNIAECRSKEEGDALAWSEQHWNVSGEVEWLVLNSTDFCSQSQHNIIFFPDQFPLNEARAMCKVVGGEIGIPINDAENARVFTETVEWAGHCSNYLGSNYFKGEKVLLTLSACSSGKYSCDDGSCIDLRQKCDLRVDCRDNSDEAGCSLLSIPTGYSTTIPPPPLVRSDPLPVNISVYISSFPVIKTEELSFEAHFNLLLTWQDSRLDFLNLKKERSLNLLPSDDVTKIWTPLIFFFNANGNLFSNLEKGSRIELIAGGSARPGGPDKATEVNIFSGSEGAVAMSQLYNAVYSCDFDLLMFPFDAQDCSMIFTLTSAAANYMLLRPDNITYIGRKDLIEYTISEFIEAELIVENEFSQMKLGVRFTRRSGFYILTLYIPTVLLAVIAYFSLFFNPMGFESRISVALTSLLVLASLFTQTSNSLPKTSYFKLVDIWLFFSIVIIFMIVLFQTLGEYFSYDSLIPAKDDDKVHVLKIFSLV